MAVFADGSTLATVGGGTVEFESTKLAKQALRDKTTFTHGFNLSPNQTADIGMICGGSVVVYVQFFSGGDEQALALFSAITQAFSQRRSTWLVTQICQGCVHRMGIYSREDGLLFMETGMDERDILPLVRPRAMLQKRRAGLLCRALTTGVRLYLWRGMWAGVGSVIAHVGFAAVVLKTDGFFGNEPFRRRRNTCSSFSISSASVSITPDDYVSS
jgi:xanthine dehydrogenase accessory factor